MNKILLSSAVVVAAAVLVVGATTAFFSDTETSSGNVFTAGSIDLKVDGDWKEADLGEIHQFFNFDGIKPGDRGGNIISLHVSDNDARGRVLFNMLDNNENDCTEPELEAEEGCREDADGELLSAMDSYFEMWLDQGSTPGFQNVYWDGEEYVTRSSEDELYDAKEGNNVWDDSDDEPEVYLNETIDLRDVLEDAYDDGDCADEANEDGHNGYGYCHGLAEDGRMVGSVTYYFGFGWELPLETGNEVQSDSFGGNLGFEVFQHSNNPDPFKVEEE